jgi:hypothetical protein
MRETGEPTFVVSDHHWRARLRARGSARSRGSRVVSTHGLNTQRVSAVQKAWSSHLHATILLQHGPAASLKPELSAEPGALMGKNATKSFKMLRSGNPEEWILWRRDFNEVCAGPDVQAGAGCIRMVRQLLSDEPLKEFANASKLQANAHAKQKKHF